MADPKANGFSNGWNSFDCWTKRALAILALLAILAGSIYAYADLRNTDVNHADRLGRIEVTQQNQSGALLDLDRKMTRALTLLENMQDAH